MNDAHVMGMMPVCRVERKPIGRDRPGDLTVRLSALYQEELNRSLG